MTRYRTKLKGALVAEKNRFLKILEDTNIKLSVVLNDVFGSTGRSILKVILEQESYQSLELLLLVDKRVKADREDIVKALEGHIDQGHRYILKFIFKHIQELEAKIIELDQEIASVSGPYKQELALLQTIPGVGETLAVGIIAEIGVDMEQFPSHKHLASWAGISPGNNESAGKNRSGRITQGNKWLKSKLVEGAWAASHSKDTYLQTKYRSLVGRKGPKKAIVALGHKILIAAYFMIKEKKSYKELGSTYLDKFRKDKLITFYKKQLANLEQVSESLTSV